MFAPLILVLAAQTTGTPRLSTRPAIAYVGIRSVETFKTLPTVLARLEPRLNTFLKANHIQATGPVFIRFLRVNRQNKIDLVVGKPTKKPVPAKDGVAPGILPPGPYVSMNYNGDFAGLMAVNGKLQKWAFANKHMFMMKMSRHDALFACWMQTFHSDPLHSKNLKAEVSYRVLR